MKRFLAVTAGMLALAVVPAGAAPPIPVYNWTGFYLGGNVGYGNGLDSFTAEGPFLPSPSMSVKSNGFFGGGEAGFNYEFPNFFVVGVEADGDWSGINGSAQFCAFAGNCTSTKVSLDDFGTVRGRLGFAWNNVLVYGTGGWAWGDGKIDSTTTSGAIVNNTNSLSGWTAGAGLEVGLLSFPGWTVKLEYLHIQYDKLLDQFPWPVTSHTAYTVTGTASDRFDTLRFGVNYLFSWGPAPIMVR